MFTFSNNKLMFYTIDLNYIQYLHNFDSEVFFDSSSLNYSTKPYIGILVANSGYDYFIPLTSAKEKHKKWHNVTKDNYLIYEIVPSSQLNNKQIYVTIPNTYYSKHILSVLEIKKMIPVKSSLYHPVNFQSITDVNYRNLMLKEYNFLAPLMPDIVNKADYIYSSQKETGKIFKFYCNYGLLESLCDSYK